MKRHDHAKNLIILARKDLNTAKIIMESNQPMIEIAGFHLQQSVEKALKAWLDVSGIVYPKTHVLHLLFSELEDNGTNINDFKSLTELTPFAVQFRYELCFEEEFEWKEVYHKTDRLLVHVQQLLEEGNEGGRSN